jgi:hypothetical protein
LAFIAPMTLAVPRDGTSVVQMPPRSTPSRKPVECLFHRRDERRRRRAELRRWQIVVARALVAQRLLDQNEIGRRPQRPELARRRDADEQPAPRCERLLGSQDSERGANRAGHDAEFDAAWVKR